jgi:hypothetical protein
MLPCLLIVTLLAAAACRAPVSGFAPVYPVQTYSPHPFSDEAMDILDWVEVDSLQPTLRWEPFPGTTQAMLGGQTTPFVDVDLAAVSDVTYDLRIWETSRGTPAQLVYEREGLVEPSHRVESPLKPRTRYAWSVRSRFRLDGRPRASEWSVSQIPCPPAYGTNCARGLARRLGTIPPHNYYRFETPAASTGRARP